MVATKKPKEKLSQSDNKFDSTYTQIWITIASGLVILPMGLSEGFTSPAIASMQASKILEFPSITEDEASWIGSLPYVGAFFGSILQGWYIEIGPRRAMSLLVIPRLISWACISLASSVVWVLVGRFIFGVTIGLMFMAAIIYLADTTDPATRGSLTSILIVAVNSGIMIAYMAGKFLSWRMLSLFCGLLNLVASFPIFFVAESPSHYRFKDNFFRCEEATQWTKAVFGDAVKDSEAEQDAARPEPAVRPRKVCKDFFRSDVLKPLSILFVFIALQRFCGYFVIILYAVSFFRAVGFAFDEHDCAILISVFQLLVCVFAPLLVTSGGRRWLAVVSYSVMGCCFLLIATYLLFLHSSKPAYHWMLPAGLLGVIAAYSLGPGPLKFVLVSDLLPGKFQNLCSAAVGAWMWLSLFFATKLFFDMKNFLGISGMCLFFSAVCCLATLFHAFVVPDNVLPAGSGKELNPSPLATSDSKAHPSHFGTFDAP